MRSFEDFALSTQILKRLSLDNVIINECSDDLMDILRNNPKLVVALNHGPMLAPGYVNTAIADIFLKNGGAKRKPMGIIWKHFYKVPLLKNLVAYVTQVDQAYNLDEFIEQFVTREYNDLMVMPEGENCCFGDGINIEPFLSPRFVEIAVRAQVPVLLAVHHGTHVLARPIEVDKRTARWFKRVLPEKNYQRLKEAGLVSIPKLGRGKVHQLSWCFKLYHPKLAADQLADDKEARMAQLWEEANHIREIMQESVDLLKKADREEWISHIA